MWFFKALEVGLCLLLRWPCPILPQAHRILVRLITLLPSCMVFSVLQCPLFFATPPPQWREWLCLAPWQLCTRLRKLCGQRLEPHSADAWKNTSWPLQDVRTRRLVRRRCEAASHSPLCHNPWEAFTFLIAFQVLVRGDASSPVSFRPELQTMPPVSRSLEWTPPQGGIPQLLLQSTASFAFLSTFLGV